MRFNIFKNIRLSAAVRPGVRHLAIASALIAY
jgi:hypothetical protein